MAEGPNQEGAAADATMPSPSTGSTNKRKADVLDDSGGGSRPVAIARLKDATSVI